MVGLGYDIEKESPITDNCPEYEWRIGQNAEKRYDMLGFTNMFQL